MKTVILTCILFVISTNAIPVANHLRFASEKRAIGDSCGSGGTCKDENECGGEMKLAKSGLCPHDPANIKCCLTPNTCSLSSGQNGVCIERSHCTAAGKTPESGKCPRDGASILCCPSSDQMSIPSEGVDPSGDSSTPHVPSDGGDLSGDSSTPYVPDSGDCGPYTGPTTPIEGNEKVTYDCYKIAIEHWAGSQSSLDLPSDKKDNSIEKSAACAFSRMHDAAKAAGVEMKITSGFRVLARQQYFWDCGPERNCNCNNCNVAAYPGRSNHGRGKALDIANAGGKASYADGNFCKKSPVYAWLQQHGPEFGFVRTVSKECWHWEYRPDEARSPPAYQ